MIRHVSLAFCLAVGLLSLTVAQSRAETIALVGVDCPTSGVSFDDDTHSLWYDRFWTGSCSGLWFDGCWPGESWPDLIHELANKHDRTAARTMAPRFCALGRAIGHEWARDNDVRRISTEDLQGWYEDLRQAHDLEAALTRYESLVKARLGAQ